MTFEQHVCECFKVIESGNTRAAEFVLKKKKEIQDVQRITHRIDSLMKQNKITHTLTQLNPNRTITLSVLFLFSANVQN